jgi:hypothetical protein
MEYCCYYWVVLPYANKDSILKRSLGPSSKIERALKALSMAEGSQPAAELGQLLLLRARLVIYKDDCRPILMRRGPIK